MHQLPPLNALRAFESVVRTGSLSAAARDLGVTHGAISLHIRTLEGYFDRPLFTREGNRLMPTTQAMQYYRSLNTALMGMAAATGRLRHAPTPATLRIACVPGLLSHWLLPRLDDLAALLPGTELHVLADNDPGLLRDDGADLCICYAVAPGDPEIRVQALAPVRLFPVASPALLARQPLEGPMDLTRHRLLHGDAGAEWHSWLSSLPEPIGPQSHRHLGDARLALEAAAMGQGVALGDAITTARALRQGDLIAPIPHGILTEAAFFVAGLSSRWNEPTLGRVVSWLVAAMQVAEGEG